MKKLKYEKVKTFFPPHFFMSSLFHLLCFWKFHLFIFSFFHVYMISFFHVFHVAIFSWFFHFSGRLGMPYLLAPIHRPHVQRY